MATKTEKTEMTLEQENEKLKKELEALKGQKAAEVQDKANDPYRKVTITLFKDQSKYAQPLYVNVNDYNALIPRGKPVQVPFYVYMHIKEMQEQDAATANMISLMEDDYMKAARAAGV